MAEDILYRRVLSGEARWAGPIRLALLGGEQIYRAGIALRNAYYDRRGPRYSLKVPVISVGNLTVGGTGKTPFVIGVVHRLEEMGCQPAVVARGYRAAEGEPGDEERLVHEHCPSVPYVADSDRAGGATLARTKFGADVIVLDDGFQHRRLDRTLDIVLIDATCPFGYDHLLPRGLLREPATALRRADMVVLTRCDQVSKTVIARIEERLARLAADAVRLKCNHVVTGVEHLDGTPVDFSLEGKRAVLLAGLANPHSFLTTVRSLGVEVVDARWRSDHHYFTRKDIRSAIRRNAAAACDFVMTTEKDAVKLRTLPLDRNAEILVVKIGIDFTGDDGRIFSERLRDAIGRFASRTASERRARPQNDSALQTH